MSTTTTRILFLLTCMFCMTYCINVDYPDFEDEIEPEKSHALAKRSYDFTDYDWVGYFDRLYTPKSWTTQLANSFTNNWVFRTLTYITAASVYFFLLNVTTGETKAKLETLDYFFNMRSFMGHVGRNLRNWSMVLFGRFVFDMIVYGPTYTIQAITEKSLPEIITSPFDASRTRTFTARFILEGFGMVIGWMTYAAITQIATNPGGERKKRSVEDMFPSDKVQDVSAKIRKDFQEVVESVSDPFLSFY